MQVFHSASTLRQTIFQDKSTGRMVALVPTMGALHAGHLSLITEAKRHADKVIVSIFVNPTQFAPHEDFNAYPRLESQDLALLEHHGVDYAYLPSATEMYPTGFATHISVGEIGQRLCGITRPHFFDGVALVVTKLFLQVMPDIALFGEKDFQQLQVIQQLVRDLNIPVNVHSCPIVRDSDGLALSSRNRYLSEQERRVASELYKALEWIASELSKPNPQAIDDLRNHAAKELIADGFSKVDYIEVCDESTLVPLVHPVHKPARILGAAILGTTRLIDNIRFLPTI